MDWFIYRPNGYMSELFRPTEKSMRPKEGKSMPHSFISALMTLFGNLTESVNTRQMEMENRAILREWYDRVDSDKTGCITATQLKSAFAVGNLHFSTSVVQQMIRMYDFDKNGTMSFEEFVELNKFLLKVQQAFSDLERGRGFLVPDEVYKALVKLDFPLDSPAFYTVCESFDQTRCGKFRLDDFIALCIFVQSSRNLFNSFDTSKQGRVTLDLNQFIYCTANCRI